MAQNGAEQRDTLGCVAVSASCQLARVLDRPGGRQLSMSAGVIWTVSTAQCVHTSPWPGPCTVWKRMEVSSRGCTHPSLGFLTGDVDDQLCHAPVVLAALT